MKLSPELNVFLNDLLFETPGGTRYTQDTPILPTVWSAFLRQPRSQQELILSVNRSKSSAKAAKILREALSDFRRSEATNCRFKRAGARVSFIPGQIAVKVYFDELIRIILPLTAWWSKTQEELQHIKTQYKRRIKNNSSSTHDMDGFFTFSTANPKTLTSDTLTEALMLMRREIDFRHVSHVFWNKLANKSQKNKIEKEYATFLADIPSDLVWLSRICGVIYHGFETGKPLLPSSLDNVRALWASKDKNSEDIAYELAGLPLKLYLDFQARNQDDPSILETQACQLERVSREGLSFSRAYDMRAQIAQTFLRIFENWSDKFKPSSMIWSITRNRPVSLAIEDSSLTTKADAAKLLFNISCSNITWAVIDSGIDASHPAFALNTEAHEEEVRRNKPTGSKDKDGRAETISVRDLTKTRVIQTLDFTQLRSILDVDIDGFDDDDPFFDDEMVDEYIDDSLEDVEPPDPIKTEIEKNRFEAKKQLFENIARNLAKKPDHPIIAEGTLKTFKKDELLRLLNTRWPGVGRISDNKSTLYNAVLRQQEEDQNLSFQERCAAVDYVDNLKRRIAAGQDINWRDFQDIIKVKSPTTPTNDHGTHVAGILGADWIEDFDNEEDLPLSQRSRKMRGICPDIKLIDVRVFNEKGLTDEFELIAAVQYLRWMNEKAGYLKVHGANLSLSLVHEVRRFACGQTPICMECNESVTLGMVMVAAAGNRGFEFSGGEHVTAKDNFKSVSITDPGNAEKVITVGSTHRKRPHEYGVSYFSSRGPTGDGRLKPDLVAPGEKILGPTPDQRFEKKDGTSMAAPHVSGAAAMLMARHSELVGKPERIKQILCDTATDLGRERYFQGHGLLDILRALQSI